MCEANGGISVHFSQDFFCCYAINLHVILPFLDANTQSHLDYMLLLHTIGFVLSQHYDMIILGYLLDSMKAKMGNIMILYGHFNSTNALKGGSSNRAFIQTGK